MKALTKRQSLFVTEYLVDQNATHAAIRAGYSAKGAHVTACRLLKRTNVRDAVMAHQRQVVEKSTVDAAWLLSRLGQLAEADITEAFNPDGSLKKIHDMPEPVRLLINGFETSHNLYRGGEEIIRKMKVESRLKVLEMIGKHVSVGAFRQDAEPARGLVVIIKDYSGREIGVVETEAKEIEA